MELKEVFHVGISPATVASNAASWSEDDRIAVITEGGLHILKRCGLRRQRGEMAVPKPISMKPLLWFLLLVVLMTATPATSSNITDAVFGTVTDGMPAAFADFNSNNNIDLFVLRDSGKTLELLLASDQEPLLKPGSTLRCTFPAEITSVVPGHFDADSHMDVLVTTNHSTETRVYVLWGGDGIVNCSKEPLFSMRGQPLAVDYNHDMIVDLFGVNTNNKRMFWVFNETRGDYMTIEMSGYDDKDESRMKEPHSHSFLNLGGDLTPDLLLTTRSEFEIWYGSEQGGFTFNRKIAYPKATYVGQSVFVDVELKGNLSHLVPVCFNSDCSNSSILVYEGNEWHNLHPRLQDSLGKVWGFVTPIAQRYLDTITLRAGDFNMDGYPDLLVTLRQTASGKPHVFLLENVACSQRSACDGMERTFSISSSSLTPPNTDCVAGMFYDLYQDGMLDVILVGERVSAFRNTLDYDANFVKVMVLVGPHRGGNFPGAHISYRTTTQEGDPQEAVSAQLPQSAHFSLGLPYTIFGLGRTPNFIDTLCVTAGGQRRDWPQIIPNSQVVVLVWALDNSGGWRAQLFVTPSKLILLSVAALLGTCTLITAIIAALYYKERREDRLEKLQEAHRFHFDAM